MRNGSRLFLDLLHRGIVLLLLHLDRRHPSLVRLQHGQAVLDGVEEAVLDLELVLVVGVGVAEVPELLGLVEAPLKVLGGDKVLGDLDAVVDIANLEWNKK